MGNDNTLNASLNQTAFERPGRVTAWRTGPLGLRLGRLTAALLCIFTGLTAESARAQTPAAAAVIPESPAPARAAQAAPPPSAGPPAASVDLASPVSPAGTAVQIVSPGVSVRELIAAGKHDEALARLDQDQAAAPGDDEVRLQRARLLYWKGRHRQALAEAELVLARHPADTECMELIGALRTAQGDLRGAVAMYRSMRDVGDLRPEVQQKIVDLLMVLEDLDAVTEALRQGGKLSDEQQLRWSAAKKPWLWGAATSLTLYRDQQWPRVEALGGHRFGKQLTLTGSAQLERRTPGGVDQWAWSGLLGAYLNAGRLDIAAFVGGSPSQAFLPSLDARLDAAFALTQRLGLGLWVRWARYTPSGAPHASPLTIAPNLPMSFGRWSVAPGWMFLLLDSGWAHTASLKLRFDADPRTAVLIWAYLGQDPNFIDRLTSQPAAGVTALLGVDRWVTSQLGVRLSASRIQPIGDFPSFTEFSLSLRGRQ
jgi:hypothetical protein